MKTRHHPAEATGRKQGKAPHSAPGSTRVPAVDPGPWRALIDLWPATVLVIVTRLAFWIIEPLAAEDAYITFRYAVRFAEGHGLTYNDGERVMGFTSPLWTLWCALGAAVLRDPVFWARIWSLAADLVTLGCLAALLSRHVSRQAAWIFAAFFTAWPYFAAISATGLEMSAALAMLALSAWLLERRRDAVAGLAAGTLALIRPEGLACAAVLALWMGTRGRLIAGGLVAAGAAALALYFGSPVPQSLISKAAVYGTPGPLGGRHWWEWLSPAELGRWPATQEGLQLFVLRILLVPAAAVGLWHYRRSPVARVAVACLAVLAGYAVLGVAYFFWYLLIPLAGVAMLMAAGLPQVVRGRAVYVTSALLLAGSWTTQPAKIYASRSKVEAVMFGAIGDRLAARGLPGEKVFVEPIGLIGYRARQLRVLDETGLVTPEVAGRRRQGAGWYADLVEIHRPEWIVIRYGVLAKLTPFAGVGAPFRSEAELDSMLAHYEPLYTTSQDPSANDFAIARRVDAR